MSQEQACYGTVALRDVDRDGTLEFIVGGIAVQGVVRVLSTDWPMPPSKFCVAKVNSQGCSPTMSSSGSLSGPDDFAVQATNVINKKWGLYIWSNKLQSVPFQNGWLCVGSPQKRSNSIFSGGSPTGADCSGVMNYSFTHAAMASSGRTAGSMFVM